MYHSVRWLVRLFGIAALCQIATDAGAAEESHILGVFNGCTWGKVYELDNGKLLVCRNYQYAYSYSPKVIVIDTLNVVIDGNQYQAEIAFGQVLHTRVSGTFNGCNYDTYVNFENDLIFKCEEYNYYYAYSPEVKIVSVGTGYTVYIDGKKFSGTLYRK